MPAPPPPEQPRSADLLCRELSIPELVADVYAEAPAVEDRFRLLQPMLAPLGILSLAAVAGGVFSWLILCGTCGGPGARFDALARIRPRHVLALAEQALQVDPESISGLAGVLLSSPSLCATATAAALLAALASAGGAR